jgi:hypothetical protein
MVLAKDRPHKMSPSKRRSIAWKVAPPGTTLWVAAFLARSLWWEVTGIDLAGVSITDARAMAAPPQFVLGNVYTNLFERWVLRRHRHRPHPELPLLAGTLGRGPGQAARGDHRAFQWPI